jgi:hypothetical protein
MSILRFTICSYFPDAARSVTKYDFAVIAAAEKCAAFVGVNLSEYRIESKHPLAQHVLDHTLEIVHNRLRESCSDPSPSSGFELLDRVVSANPSSLAFSPIEEVETDASVIQVAAKVFAPRAMRHFAEAAQSIPSRISGHWFESPEADLRTSTRQIFIPSQTMVVGCSPVYA